MTWGDHRSWLDFVVSVTCNKFYYLWIMLIRNNLFSVIQAWSIARNDNRQTDAIVKLLKLDKKIKNTKSLNKAEFY